MTHSKRFREAAKAVDRTKQYSLDEAITVLKQTATTKFDAGVELHCNLGIDAGQSSQTVKGTVALPHGTGKTVRVAAFVPADKEAAVKAAGATVVGGEELIKQIKQTEKTDFDVAVATPELMRSLGQIAKILGTRGLMPSPKNETVTADPAKAVSDLQKGKIAFKNDNSGQVHILAGKVSFDDAKLKENIAAILEAIKSSKPADTKGTFLRSVTLSTSMGPGIKLQL